MSCLSNLFSFFTNVLFCSIHRSYFCTIAFYNIL
nr:MAG TPA: hypothetical protein [Bacteriophage sp.]